MKILFLCVANSARSQMAEGLARKRAPANTQIFSAGSRPGRVHPLAVQAMARLDIDISSHHSKGIDQVPLGGVDMVITLCAEEICPAPLQGAEHLHWPIDDPAGHADEPMEHQLARFMSARDAIQDRLGELFPATPEHSKELAATAYLKIVKGPAKGELLALHGEALSLGRGADNDLQIPDPSISRHHLRFSAYKDGWRLEDLGTANGTRVDGRRTMQEILRSGAKISTGDTVFEYLSSEELAGKRRGFPWRSKAKQPPQQPPQPTPSPMAERATVAVLAMDYQKPPKGRPWLLWALGLVGALAISVSLALHFAERTRREQAQGRIDSLRQEAEQSLREQRWADAHKKFSRVLTLDSEDASARQALAELNTAKLRYEQALSLADKGELETLKRSLESFLPGQPYHNEAQQSLRALRSKPAAPQAEAQSESPRSQAQAPTRAPPRRAARTAPPVSKGRSTASLEDGLQHYRAGRFKEAAAAFSLAAAGGEERGHALAKAVTALDSHLQRGNKALQEGRIDAAIPALSEALKHDKRLGAAFSAGVRSRLAGALVRQGNAALARKELVPAARAVAKALSYERKHPQALRLVEALEQRGRALLIEAVSHKSSRPDQSRRLAKTVTRITSTRSQTHTRAKALLTELAE